MIGTLPPSLTSLLPAASLRMPALRRLRRDKVEGGSTFHDQRLTLSRQARDATKPILFLSGESSAYRGLPPSLLTCPNDFTHIVSWSYLPQRPILQGRMLRHELNGMIHIPRLKHADAAELLVATSPFLQYRVNAFSGG